MWDNTYHLVFDGTVMPGYGRSRGMDGVADCLSESWSVEPESGRDCENWYDIECAGFWCDARFDCVDFENRDK